MDPIFDLTFFHFLTGACLARAPKPGHSAGCAVDDRRVCGARVDSDAGDGRIAIMMLPLLLAAVAFLPSIAFASIAWHRS